MHGADDGVVVVEMDRLCGLNALSFDSLRGCSVQVCFQFSFKIWKHFCKLNLFLVCVKNMFVHSETFYFYFIFEE